MNKLNGLVAVTFLLVNLVAGQLHKGIFSETSQSLKLNHVPAKYDNRTDVVRLRRQSPLQACKGDVLKFQCARTTDCISSELECDGKEDCPDGSDEEESLCKDFSKKCKTPGKPDNGQWINLNNRRQDYLTSQIDENSVIKYSCNPGYKLSTTIEASLLVHCLPIGEWSQTELPICQKLCQSLYNSPLITLSCKNDGSSVRCDKATDNTIVTYKCAPYYEAPYGRPRSSTCYDGVWDFIPQCIPVCGERRVSAAPLIVNGHEVERGHYPWVVAIYSHKDSDPYFTNICGGSLISTEIVLTAAHCVSRKETGNVYDAKYFRVGAGKYYSLYEDPRDVDTAQYSEVALIETHTEYKGEIQNFRADIALLKLKTSLVFSKVVQPVCYNNLPTIEPNTVGLVTGWGYTSSSGEPSDTLKELELPYNADRQCLKDLDKDFSDRYFTSDKLCAGFNDQNTSVCSGDSGGGLVFRNPSFRRRYFVHGIVSLAHSYKENQKVHCNIQRSALFTKVENYIEWIQLKVRHWTRNNNKKCRAPAQSDNGRWAYLNNTNKDASNQVIDANTAIIFSCNEGHRLSTNKDSLAMFCMPTGKWNVTAMPLCQRKSMLPGEVSNRKCLEYSEYVWTTEPSPTLMSLNEINIRRSGCPFNRQKRVVGGTSASRREFPHMVQLGFDSSYGIIWACGGSLISDEYVLTSARCVSDRRFGIARYARMGIIDLEDDDHLQEYNISEVIPYPQYDARLRNNDIGLVRLNKRVELNTWVRPACLYTKNDSTWTNVIASGWGLTDFAGASSTVLLKVILEVYDQPSCNRTYGKLLKEGIKDEIIICAGHSSELRDTCQGDSGGPIQVYRNEEQLCMYEIVGVTSFGKACGIAVNTPSVYTRVSYYIKWIEDIVWPPT